MTELDKSYYINTGRNGILADTSVDDVEKLIAAMKKHKKVVLYFHGGLVSKKSGLKSAGILHKDFLKAGAHPVFFIWESGLVETLTHNFDEIDKDEVFRIILKYAVQFAVGKLTDLQGGKSTGRLVLPNDLDVAIELEKTTLGAEPYSNVQRSPQLQPLNEAEQDRFEKTLQSDQELQQELNAIALNSLSAAERESLRSKGASSVPQRPVTTLLSQEVVEELKDDVLENQGKSAILSAKLILRAGKILKRVVQRFFERRDHGVYCTVVEELLRELYFDRIGTAVWEMMKKETVDTFENPDPQVTRGGWYFLKRLSELLEAGYEPEITLIGHSAGTIFVCNLLRNILKLRQSHPSPALEKFRFRNVVFLAPACDFKLFHEVLSKQDALFENFRMFALSDQLESGKPLLPFLPMFYTRSLLYFVSGLLERESDDPQAFAYDAPLVGLRRVYTDPKTYKNPEIAAVREFLDGNPRRIVWVGETQGAPGLLSAADQHGGFAEEPDTRASLVHIIEKGWDV